MLFTFSNDLFLALGTRLNAKVEIRILPPVLLFEVCLQLFPTNDVPCLRWIENVQDHNDAVNVVM
jgi:hypothetical protein